MSEPIVNYILSPCPLAAIGLKELEGFAGQQTVLLNHETIITLPPGDRRARVIVYLPDGPDIFLKTLRQVAFLIEQASYPFETLMLSKSKAGWLMATLKNSLENSRALKFIFSISSDLSCHDINNVICQKTPDSLKLLTIFEEEVLLTGVMPEGLSRSELNVVVELMNGVSVSSLARKRGVSTKTLYTQKKSAIDKLILNHPNLAHFFYVKRTDTENNIECLSRQERELLHAIRVGNFHIVYQIITDGNSTVGMELLSRWHKENKTLLPGNFLPCIKSNYVWMLLTFFVLEKAIKSINHFDGKIIISINIPDSLAGSHEIIRITNSVLPTLKNPSWVNKLAFEFPETMDVRKDINIRNNMDILRGKGIRLMLDDCFSESSVIFPARTFFYDDYKLDMTIVNDAEHDCHARILISSLVYYCQISERRCIAEGVDTESKLSLMKEIGVSYFQGDLFSPTLTEVDIGVT